MNFHRATQRITRDYVSYTIISNILNLSIANGGIFTLLILVIEQIQHMHTGLLFSPGNENDFKEKLDYLTKNPSEIKRMGANARKFARANYDWNNIIKEYEALYEKTIKDFYKINISSS